MMVLPENRERTRFSRISVESSAWERPSTTVCARRECVRSSTLPMFVHTCIPIYLYLLRWIDLSIYLSTYMYIDLYL